MIRFWQGKEDLDIQLPCSRRRVPSTMPCAEMRADVLRRLPGSLGTEAAPGRSTVDAVDSRL